MTPDSPDSSRREFLTGEAARKELLHSAARLGDALLEQQVRIPVASDTIHLETRAMACPWCVIMNPGPPRQVMVASDAFLPVHEVESRLTIYRSDSLISEINRQAYRSPQTVDEPLFRFLLRCLSLWRQTSGAFDVAAGRLIDLWKQCRQAGRVPDAAEVQEAIQRSGSAHVVLDEGSRTVSFERDVKLDFAGIGKGLAIDLAAKHMKLEGVNDFLIHGGHSSLRAAGRHGGEDGWPVGLRNPQFTDRPWATVLLKDQALSSSGSNIQFFRYGGKRYGHILDPRTGWPAEGLLSVTVICQEAAEADALSTALFVMGLDNAMRYCDDHPEIGAILIPNPERSRRLDPVVCNIPDNVLFFPEEEGSG